MPRSIAHIDDVKGVARRLKQRRVALGLSQRQLAFPGCTAAYISRLEAAARVPSRQMLDELAARLRTSRQWLESGADVIALTLSRSAVDAAIAAQFTDGEDGVTWDTLNDDERRWMLDGMHRGATSKAAHVAAAIQANRRAKAEAAVRLEDELAAHLDQRLQRAVEEPAC